MKVKEAAELSGRSPSTIRRDIDSGRLSASKKGRAWDIDPAELARAYDLKIEGDALITRQMVRKDASRRVTETPHISEEMAHLRAALETAQAMAEERRKTVDDLRDRLDRAERRADESQTRLTALLSDQRPPPAEQHQAKPVRAAFVWVLLLALAVAAGFLAYPYFIQ